MKHTGFLFPILALALAAQAPAADAVKPLLAVPGKVIYENKLDAPPGEPWKTRVGKWELAEGAWKGSERAEDNHGAVARLPRELPDFIIEYEVKLDGARSTTLSLNAVKDHMARIIISPKLVTVQRDDNDHGGPDKAVVFARIPAEIAPGVWHKVRMEMVGDTMLGQVDGVTAWGSDDLFKTPRKDPGFTVAGESVAFRNLVIREAALNPDWEAVKATLPAPGSQVAPVGNPGAKGKKGKGKAKPE